MTQYTIYIGSTSSPSFTFTNPRLMAMTGTLAVDIVGEYLSVDEIKPTIRYNPNLDTRVRWAPKGYKGLVTADRKLMVTANRLAGLDSVTAGTPVWCYVDADLLMKGYVSTVTRTARDRYTMQLISPIGILDKQQHLGNVYTGETLASVVAEIIDGAISYTIDPDVANESVYNWLPIDSKRENLHKLLMAMGCCVEKDANGDVYITYISNADTAAEIPTDRIYNTGSVEYNTSATGVEVTEHSFVPLATDQIVTLFDNTQGSAVTNAFIAFSQAPIHHPSASGLTVHSSGVNWAVVSGTGTLTGKIYTHTTQVIRLDTDNPSNAETHIVRVTDNPLISLVNSQNIARRLLNFYANRKTIKNAIVLDAERPGKLYSFQNPYREQTEALLTKMNLTAGGFIKAGAEFVSGFTPVPPGNNFSNVSVLSGSTTTWVAPVTGPVRFVLFGAGNGGSSGEQGRDGEAGPSLTSENNVSYNWAGGSGGAAGQGGVGGKVLIIDLEVTAGETFELTYGAGGSGGVCSGTSSTQGQSGGATTLRRVSTGDTWSSGNGNSLLTGYYDPISMVRYAASGDTGLGPGARGSDGKDYGTGAYAFGQTLYTYGNRTTTGSFRYGFSFTTIQPATGFLTTQIGGYGGSSWRYYNDSGFIFCRGQGGFGGGPAVGSNGESGTAGYTDENIGEGFANGGTGGQGGKGADGSNATTIGQGGQGGSGGGGGGAGGYAYNYNGTDKTWYGSGGLGGMGGSGGKGANGGALVYT